MRVNKMLAILYIFSLSSLSNTVVVVVSCEYSPKSFSIIACDVIRNPVSSNPSSSLKSSLRIT